MKSTSPNASLPKRFLSEARDPAGGTAAESNMGALLRCFPRDGKVLWIGVRPQRRGVIDVRDKVEAVADVGLAGDHYRSRSNGKRQVTLIQAEHLAVVGALLGEDALDPARLRRNIVVSDINLLALKDRRFRIGDALFEASGLAHPCSRMEEELGAGGYNAMRGHGGLTARVIRGGVIRVGDIVRHLEDAEDDAAARPSLGLA
jgi:MOSC domain-containing protein YiiM